MTEAEIAEFLDQVADQNGLGILAGHTQYDEFSKSRLRETIQMIKGRNIEVVTLRKALTSSGVIETTPMTTGNTPTSESSMNSDQQPVTTATSTTQTPRKNESIPVNNTTESTTSKSRTTTLGLLTGTMGVSVGLLTKYINSR